MLTGSLKTWPVAYDAFSTGISGRTFARPMRTYLLCSDRRVELGLPRGHRSGPGRPGLREGDDAARQGDLRAHAAAIERERSGLEQLHDSPGGPFRSHAVTGQQGHGRSGLLGGDPDGGAESLLDAIRHAPSELTTRMGPDLKLQTVEVHDVVHRDIVLTVGINRVFYLLFRRIAHFPDMMGAPTADDVVTAQGPGGSLEPDGAKAPRGRPGR